MELWLWVLSTPLFTPTTITAVIWIIQRTSEIAWKRNSAHDCFHPEIRPCVPVPLPGWTRACCSSPKVSLAGCQSQISESPLTLEPLHVKKARCRGEKQRERCRGEKQRERCQREKKKGRCQRQKKVGAKEKKKSEEPERTGKRGAKEKEMSQCTQMEELVSLRAKPQLVGAPSPLLLTEGYRVAG